MACFDEWVTMWRSAERWKRRRGPIAREGEIRGGNCLKNGTNEREKRTWSRRGKMTGNVSHPLTLSWISTP